MPPEGGITRETPTGKAVGQYLLWHNFSCYRLDCYAIDYLKASETERELCKGYESLGLSKEQKELIDQLISAIYAENAAHAIVMFRMAMQYCFSLLVRLADLM